VTEQPTEAARVRVARLPQEFCVWSVFYQSRPSGRWAPWASGDDKEKAIKYCRYLAFGINQSPALMTHYDGDPEALYFDRDHPEGVPVEWEDVR